MPKNKSSVFNHFKEEKDRRGFYKCKYCKVKKYKKHATRMGRHLTECSDTPAKVKNAYRKLIIGASTSKGSKPVADTMSAADQRKGNTLLGRYILNSGTAYLHVEHRDLKKFINFLRPSYVLPKRKVISGEILNAEYTRIKKLVEEKIEASKYMSLQLDSWTNIRNENITHVMMNAGPSSVPLFLYGVCGEGNRHDSQFYVNVMSDAILKYGSGKITAVITDNAAVMVKAGEDIEKKFEGVTHVRCASHSIHLLIGKIVESKTNDVLIKECKEVVKCIKNRSIAYAIFREKKGRNNRATLHLPGATRWGSNLKMLTSLKKFRSALEQTVVDPSILKEVAEIKSLVLSEDYWLKVDTLVDFLTPFLKWIRMFEKDNSQIHLAVECFRELDAHFNTYLDNPILGLSEEEKTSIATYFNTKEILTLKSIHYAAHLLDPLKQGLYLSPAETILANEYLYTLALTMPDIDPTELISEIGQYKSKEGLWSSNFVWLWVQGEEAKEPIDRAHPKTWWLGVGPSCNLSKIAVRILSTPISSALTERSFSSRGFIHNKLRNQMTNPTAEKNVYVYMNSRNFDETELDQPSTSATQTLVLPSTSTANQSTSMERLDDIADIQMDVNEAEESERSSVSDEEEEDFDYLVLDDHESEESDIDDDLEEYQGQG